MNYRAIGGGFYPTMYFLMLKKCEEFKSTSDLTDDVMCGVKLKKMDFTLILIADASACSVKVTLRFRTRLK